MANDIWTAPSGPSAGVGVLAEMQAQRTDNINVLGLVADGDSSTQKAHRHKTGTLANRPTAGEAGREYYATDLGAGFIDDGSQWLLKFVVHQIAQHLFDDFALTKETKAGFGWDEDFTNSGNLIDTDLPYSVITLRTGATGSSRSSIRAKALSTAGTYGVGASAVPALYAARLGPPTTTDAFVLAGLWRGAPAIGASPTDGIYFRRTDAGGVGNWFAVTRASSTETATDTGIAGDTDMHRFEIQILATNQVKFYIDGTEEGDHSTNIPTANIQPIFSIDNSAAANKEMRLDYIEWVAKRE